MTSSPTPERPFGDIALCLSGGGYRAAAFHLGTLDMLDDLGLLSDVRLLSTVSGGTIIGIAYAVWKTEGQSFAQFYTDFYAFLNHTNVVQQALAGLYDVAETSAARHLSLIRAAARTYADALVGERRFGLLLNQVGTHFTELIFNATEFRIGNAFRFRASQNRRAVIGNGNFRISRPVAEQIRLADIMAASSCFPAAFEPIRFPDDFQWDNLDDVRRELQSGFQDEGEQPVCVPLMDGGIYDNQGLDSAKMADDVDDPDFDLFIVSDSNQRDDAVLDFPVERRRGWLPLRHVARLLRLVLVLCLTSAVAVVMQYECTVRASGMSLLDYVRLHPYELIFAYAIPFLLAVTVGLGLTWVRWLVRRVQKVHVVGADFALWPVVKDLTVPDLLEMLKGRFSSLTALASTVFMKRIRSLLLQYVITNPKRRERLAFNVLYEILLSHPKLEAQDAAFKPSAQLREVVEGAEAMPTTLWFPRESDLRTLIVCGQATLCFNILKYLRDKQEDALQDPCSAVSQMYQRARDRWLALQRDAYCLLDRNRL